MMGLWRDLLKRGLISLCIDPWLCVGGYEAAIGFGIFMKWRDEKEMMRFGRTHDTTATGNEPDQGVLWEQAEGGWPA